MKTLTWKYDTTEPAPCPDFQVDPYTGQFPTTSCLVYHFKNVTKEMAKSFETDEEIENFKKNAPQGCYDWKVAQPL